MLKFLKLSDSDKRIVINDYSRQSNIPLSMIEKDIWVCYFLDYLFNRCSYKDYFVFKGGTSLSKCYNLIERFSEDLDIVLSPSIFDISLDEIMQSNQSRNQNEKFINMIDNKAMDFIESTLIPIIKNDVKYELSLDLQIELLKEDLAFNIFYPILHGDGYLRPYIKIEMSSLSALAPVEEKEVTSYIGMMYPHLFSNPTFKVVAMRPERTFYEKLLILHQEAHRINGQFPSRYSRHYYDVTKIFHSKYGDFALKNTALLDDVRKFTITFYNRSWANFTTAVPGSIKLLPNEKYIASLKEDYQRMQDMIFAPDIETFEVLLRYLQDLENTINKK